MPFYDYECEMCNYLFEAFHGMLDVPLSKCPQCGKRKLIKLLSSGVMVIVKGTENPCIGGRSSVNKKNKTKVKKRDKLGEGENKSDTPWWRRGRVNKQILKNPGRYIKDGEVD